MRSIEHPFKKPVFLSTSEIRCGAGIALVTAVMFTTFAFYVSPLAAALAGVCVTGVIVGYLVKKVFTYYSHLKQHQLEQLEWTKDKMENVAAIFKCLNQFKCLQQQIDQSSSNIDLFYQVPQINVILEGGGLLPSCRFQASKIITHAHHGHGDYSNQIEQIEQIKKNVEECENCFKKIELLSQELNRVIKNEKKCLQDIKEKLIYSWKAIEQVGEADGTLAEKRACLKSSQEALEHIQHEYTHAVRQTQNQAYVDKYVLPILCLDKTITDTWQRLFFLFLLARECEKCENQEKKKNEG